MDLSRTLSVVAQELLKEEHVVRQGHHGASIDVVHVVHVVPLGTQVQLGDDHQHQQVHDLMRIQPVVKGPRFSPVLGVEGCEPTLRDTCCVDAGCHHADHLGHHDHLEKAGSSVYKWTWLGTVP